MRLNLGAEFKLDFILFFLGRRFTVAAVVCGSSVEENRWDRFKNSNKTKKQFQLVDCR